MSTFATTHFGKLLARVQEIRERYRPFVGKVVTLKYEFDPEQRYIVLKADVSPGMVSLQHNHFTATLILLDAKGNKSERYVDSPNDLILVETP